MNCPVMNDWKNTAVLGASIIGVAFVIKDPVAAKEVLVHTADAIKEIAIASKSHC